MEAASPLLSPGVSSGYKLLKQLLWRSINSAGKEIPQTIGERKAHSTPVAQPLSPGGSQS